MQHGYISRLLALKVNTQYLLKTFRKKIRAWRNLEQRSKAIQATRSQDCINTKQNSFHINSVFFFCSQKLYDSKNYKLNFIYLIQGLRAEFSQSGRRAGVQTL